MATLRNITKNCHGRDCQAEAEVYAMDPYPDGWADWYCQSCAPANWLIVDIITKESK